MFDEQSQIITFKISVRAELQADGEIDDVQVGRSTCEAAVGSGTGARFAGVVTGPADSNLVGKGTRWAATYTSTVNRKLLKPELHKCTLVPLTCPSGSDCRQRTVWVHGHSSRRSRTRHRKSAGSSCRRPSFRAQLPVEQQRR